MKPETKARLVAAIAFPLLLLSGTPSRAAAAVPAPTVRQLPHVSVEVSGRGSPVVLIPGLSSPRATYAGVIAALAKNHRVYAVQVNGFGGDAPGANLQPGMLDGVVADVHATLAADHVEGAAVVGHSMGGLLALMLAKAHPADTGKLMIVDALPFIGVIFVPGATVAMLQPQATTLRDAMAASYGKPANPAIAQAVAEHNALKPASRTQVAAWTAAADPRVTAEGLYEDMTTDLRPAMASIETPITVLVPYSDQLPEAKAHALYEQAYAAAPHHRIVDVADSGHFVMLDQPAAFGTALDAFLAD